MPVDHLGDACAEQRGGERREQRDVVGMEDAARGAEQAKRTGAAV